MSLFGEYLAKDGKLIPCPGGHWKKLVDLGYNRQLTYTLAEKDGYSRVTVVESRAYVDPTKPVNVKGVIDALTEDGVEVTNVRPMKSEIVNSWMATELTLKRPFAESLRRLIDRIVCALKG